MDAKNGQVLEKESLINQTSSLGHADTRYNGYVSFTTDLNNSIYTLLDNSRGSGIETLNLNQSDYMPNAVDFQNNTNYWLDADWDNEEKDNVALNAHWAIQEIWDYFQENHSRNSFDGNNGKITCYVHFGENWTNAAFGEGRMLIGDGDTVNTDPFASLDIIAHEFGHGISETEVGFRDENESAAINESLSDIWAACVESNIDPSNSKWRLGEDIYLDNISYARAMDNPNLKNHSDTYNGTHWDLNNPYKCGGIMNYWFYLLTEGGNGTNDKGYNYNVDGLSGQNEIEKMNKAEDLVYKMIMDYFTSESNFADARIFSIEAANDLSFSSDDITQISKAWDAVGVFNILGVDHVCYSGANFSLNGSTPTNCTINWTLSSNLSFDGSSTGSTVTIRAKTSTTSGNGTIYANIKDSYGNTIHTSQKSVGVGVPNSSYITIHGSDYLYACDYTYLDVRYNNTHSDASLIEYEWDFPDAYDWDVSEDRSTPIDMEYVEIEYWEEPSPSEETISVRVRNGCDFSDWKNFTIDVRDECSGYFMMIAPNPATEYVAVSFVATDELTPKDEGKVMTKIKDKDYTNKELKEYTIEIWSEKTGVVKRVQAKDKYLQIPVNDLYKGKYYLHIIYDNKVYKQQLIVE